MAGAAESEPADLIEVELEVVRRVHTAGHA